MKIRTVKSSQSATLPATPPPGGHQPSREASEHAVERKHSSREVSGLNSSREVRSTTKSVVHQRVWKTQGHDCTFAFRIFICGTKLIALGAPGCLRSKEQLRERSCEKMQVLKNDSRMTKKDGAKDGGVFPDAITTKSACCSSSSSLKKSMSAKKKSSYDPQFFSGYIMQLIQLATLPASSSQKKSISANRNQLATHSFFRCNCKN